MASILRPGVAARAYLDWFYQSRGIADWAGAPTAAAITACRVSATTSRSVREYFDTYEEAYEGILRTIFYVEPLPEPRHW
jgi:hypothetical protein